MVSQRTQVWSRACLIAFLGTIMIVVPACHRTKTPSAAKRFPFTGRVISIDAKSESALIDGDLIQGFMEPMAMSYKIKPASDLRQLAPGDSVSAEVVVIEPDPGNREAEPDYWLENVKVTAHAKTPPAKGPTSFHMPQPGEEVPDFAFANQNRKVV